MIIAIAAVDENWGIGYNNKLLVQIPEDMQMFKELTENNAVIMGKNTFNSIGHPLKNRINIVVTHEYSSPVRDENGVIYLNMNNLINYILQNKAIANFINQDIYIIGGASIYEQLLPYCDRALITKIVQTYKADTYFPNLDKNEKWEIAEDGEVKSFNGIQYKFTTYERIK